MIAPTSFHDPNSTAIPQLFSLSGQRSPHISLIFHGPRPHLEQGKCQTTRKGQRQENSILPHARLSCMSDKSSQTINRDLRMDRHCQKLQTYHIWLEKMKILPSVKVLPLPCQIKHCNILTNLQYSYV